MILYLGREPHDGYVLSKKTLHKLWDANGKNHYLCPRTGKCVDVEGGDVLFNALRLAPWDVVRLDVRVKRATQPRKRGKK